MLRKSLGLLPVLALAVVPCRATTVFTDGTFTLSDYTQTSYTNNTATAGATYSVTHNAGFGNPAPSLQFDVSWTVNTTFTIFDGLINSNFTYNPSTAAISTIAFSLDKFVTFTDSTVVFSNATAGALLEQSGNFYLDSLTGPSFSESTWQTVSATGLSASSFCLYSFTTNVLDCTQHPDFSTAGGVISFGFRTGLGHSNSLGTGTFDSYSDNLSFAITAVPEPNAYGLVAAGLAGLWFLRRRRARS